MADEDVDFSKYDWNGNNEVDQISKSQASNQMFGTGMSDVGSRKKSQWIGENLSAAGTGALFAGGAVAAGTIALKTLISSKVPLLKGLKLAKWAALAGAVYNVVRTGSWQYSGT